MSKSTHCFYTRRIRDDLFIIERDGGAYLAFEQKIIYDPTLAIPFSCVSAAYDFGSVFFKNNLHMGEFYKL